MADREHDENNIMARASNLYATSYRQLAVLNDRLFGRLLIVEWLAAMALALWLTPFTYSGLQRSVHIHVYAAVLLGLATVALPLFMIRSAPGSVLTRHAIAAAQMVIVGLLIGISGGRTETHFLIFGSLAFLAFYRDWRILITASIITAADHFLRGMLLPRSIYGTEALSSWRWLEHTGYVLFEDLFLISSCLFGVRERQMVCRRQAELELAEAHLRSAHDESESRVKERTLELSKINASLADELIEHRSSEICLEQTEALLSGVLKSSLDGVMAFESVRDEAGKIIDFRWLLTNPAGEKLVGKSRDELIGQRMLDILPGNKVEGLFDVYCNVVETGSAEHIERWYGQDGLSFWLELSIVKLGDGFSANFRDVSERKAIQEQLKLSKDLAESSTRAKSEFLANMSHEIRTPLTAIVGFSDIMQDPDQTQSDRLNAVQTIRRNAKHLLELINDILDLSKVEAGRMTVEQIKTELPPLLSDVMSMMRPRATDKGIELNLSFFGRIPRYVQTDPVRVKQILMNLVSNAIKFTSKGEVKIRISTDPADQTLSMEVSDTGIGITPDQITKLFQPFTQADSSTTRKFGGTGLGLTISKRLAQLLGGDISISSVVGVGSAFTARISGAGDVSGESCGIEDALVMPSMHVEHSNRAISGRILLAEDGKDNQVFISAMLRRAGAEVVIVDNGRLAVDQALAEEFDVILMDMQMPVLDGYGAASELRSRGYKGPVIALTAHAMASDRAKCISAGCTDYLVKPIDRRLLIETIAKYLEAIPPVPEETLKLLVPVESSGNEIVSTFANDPVLAEILPMFMENLTHQVRSILALLDQDKLAELQTVVHQLKGAGGSYGFDCVTRSAAVAEASIKQKEPILSIRSKVNEMLQLIRRIRGYDRTHEINHER